MLRSQEDITQLRLAKHIAISSLAWPDPLGTGTYRLKIISARRGAYNLQSISA